MYIMQKPTEYRAIQWDNNEPEIRDFVKNDSLLRFPNNKCQIWIQETSDWITVPMGYWIIQDLVTDRYRVIDHSILISQFSIFS